MSQTASSVFHRTDAVRFNRAGLLARIAQVCALTVSCIAASVAASHAQTWARPFPANSIWNTKIGTGAVYIPCNLGALGAMCNDRMWLFRTYSSDPLRPVFQPEGWEKPGVNIPNSLVIPDEPNGCASFLLPDGVTLREYNALRRPDPASNPNPVGYWYGDFSLTGDGIGGGQAGSGMSSLGGTIRTGELESTSPIPHALKLELDWAVLYKNSGNRANQSQTYRWPANRSDGNAGGEGDGPGYGGSNPALKMGALVALPKTVNINSLGLSAKGLKIAQAMQDYGAYIVDSTGVYWQWGNGGYTASISVEYNASPGYLRANNDYINNDQLFYDMEKIYSRLAVVDNNSPSSIGGGNGSTSTVPIGRTIAIKANNGKFLSTDLSNGDNPVRAGWATSVGTWERYRLDDAGGGKVALYSLNNSRYISVDNSRADKLLRAAWATGIGDWEKFTWESQGGNKFALKSQVTGKYVTSDLNNANAFLVASWANSVQGWETFEWSGL